jgi:hypothetical protein
VKNNYEIEFVEKHYEELLSYLGSRWKRTNQEVFEFIMDWSFPMGWHFSEALHSYFSYNFPENRNYLAKLIIKKSNEQSKEN